MSNQYPNDPYERDQYGRDQYGRPYEHPYRPEPTAQFERPPSQAYSAADLPTQQPRTQPPQAQRQSHKPLAPQVNPTLFIGGAVMSGVVTALAAWLAAWILRTIVEKINETGKFGIWNPLARDEYWFAVAAFLCALAAAALWYVLQIVTPSPDQFFRWTVGLLIAAAVIVPLLLSQGWEVGVATAIIHLVIGLPILTLIPTIGHKSNQ